MEVLITDNIKIVKKDDLNWCVYKLRVPKETHLNKGKEPEAKWYNEGAYFSKMEGALQYIINNQPDIPDGSYTPEDFLAQLWRFQDTALRIFTSTGDVALK